MSAEAGNPAEFVLHRQWCAIHIQMQPHEAKDTRQGSQGWVSSSWDTLTKSLVKPESIMFGILAERRLVIYFPAPLLTRNLHEAMRQEMVPVVRISGTLSRGGL